MINKRFEVYKVERELKRGGVKYEIKRCAKNQFNEPVEDDETLVGLLFGLYHEKSEYVRISTGDAARTRTEKVPMVLTTSEHIAGIDLQVGDYIVVNGKRLEITGVVNVQEWGLVYDISFRAVDGGVVQT